VNIDVQQTQLAWLLPTLWFLFGVVAYKPNVMDSGIVTHFLGLNTGSFFVPQRFFSFFRSTDQRFAFSGVALATKLYLSENPETEIADIMRSRSHAP